MCHTPWARSAPLGHVPYPLGTFRVRIWASPVSITGSLVGYRHGLLTWRMLTAIKTAEWTAFMMEGSDDKKTV